MARTRRDREEPDLQLCDHDIPLGDWCDACAAEWDREDEKETQ
jgi:hypothetical protein